MNSFFSFFQANLIVNRILIVSIVVNTVFLSNYYTVTYQAASEPPGMREGPYLAPSSPPLTPLPTNRRPLDSSSLQRLCGRKKMKKWNGDTVIINFRHTI